MTRRKTSPWLRQGHENLAIKLTPAARIELAVPKKLMVLAQVSHSIRLCGSVLPAQTPDPLQVLPKNVLVDLGTPKKALDSSEPRLLCGLCRNTVDAIPIGVKCVQRI